MAIDLTLYSFIVVVVVVVVVVKVLSSFANQLKLIDFPNHRKQHKGNVPLVGGVAMFVGFVFGAMLLAGEYIQIISLTLASFIMLVIGIIDDRSETTVITRMFVQVMLAVIIVSILGVELKSLGNLLGVGNINLGKAALIITVLAIVGGVNSFNVMDGIDGLSGGLAVVVFSAVLLLAYMEKAHDVANLSLLYLFILLPFLFFNLSRKHKVFMGDAGTLFIGVGIVWILIVSSQSEQPIFSPVIALWIYAVPLIDIISVAYLRIKNGKSPFLPDHNHIHHQIKRRYNYSNQKTLVIIIIIAALIATIGVLGQLYSVSEWMMFLGFVGLFFMYLISLIKVNTPVIKN